MRSSTTQASGTGHVCLLSPLRDMAHRLFRDNEGGIPVHKFRAFLERLHHKMIKLEFAHYDTKGIVTMRQDEVDRLLYTDQK